VSILDAEGPIQRSKPGRRGSHAVRNLTDPKGFKRLYGSFAKNYGIALASAAKLHATKLVAAESNG
jgi:hypothetical protein